MGQAAAETLIVGDEGGKKAGTLFASLGLAAIFTVLRDWFGTFGGGACLVPKNDGLWITRWNVAIPMPVAVGFHWSIQYSSEFGS